MNETQIIYFLKLVEYGSFTETAYKLYVSQSAVSKQIIALEKHLGCKLVNRNKGSVTLTVEGKLYHEFFSRFVSELQLVKSEAQKISRRIDNAFYLCVKDSIWLENLPIAIQTMVRNSANTEVVMREEPCLDVLQLLTDGKADVVVSYADLIGASGELLIHGICRAECQLIVSKMDARAYAPNLTIADFAGSQFFLPSQKQDIFGRSFVERICQISAVTPLLTETDESVHSILRMVECGLGVTIVDTKTRIHNSGNFRMIPLDGTCREIVAVCLREPLNPQTKTFIRLLKQSAD